MPPYNVTFMFGLHIPLYCIAHIQHFSSYVSNLVFTLPALWQSSSLVCICANVFCVTMLLCFIYKNGFTEYFQIKYANVGKPF